MSGPDLKEWAPKDEAKRRALAEDLGITLNTLYSWFRSAELRVRDVLALAQLGCPQAQREIEECKGAIAQ